MYLDSAYIVKFYINEHDSVAVRDVIQGAGSLVSSALAIPEVACALDRRRREGKVTEDLFQEAITAFLKHVETGIWSVIPISNRILHRVTGMLRVSPVSIFPRAGDAVHLATAIEIGELEIWTADRHMLAAAPHFGLAGRSVQK